MSDPQEPISASDLADLARAGFSISRKSFMQVNFEVHHIADRALYLYGLLNVGLADLLNSQSQHAQQA